MADLAADITRNISEALKNQWFIYMLFIEKFNEIAQLKPIFRRYICSAICDGCALTIECFICNAFVRFIVYVSCNSYRSLFSSTVSCLHWHCYTVHIVHKLYSSFKLFTVYVCMAYTWMENFHVSACLVFFVVHLFVVCACCLGNSGNFPWVSSPFIEVYECISYFSLNISLY